MSPNHVITPRHYQGIGEVVVTWARLEMHMIQTLRVLLKITQKQTIAVFWEMIFSQRSAKLRTLVQMKFRSDKDPIRTEFESLLNEIADVSPVRNLTAHSIWHEGKTRNTIAPLYIKSKKGRILTTKDRLRTPKTREFSPERFRVEAVKIADLAERFKNFSKLHFGAEFLHSAADNGFD